MLQFNNQGYLLPVDVIETDLVTFQEHFIFNEARQELFEAYLSFNHTLQKLIDADYQQWVNGSFTTKKVKPNDIDVVSFIPHTIFESLSKVFEEMYRNKHQGKIDCFFVPSYPENHARYNHYQADQLDFWHKFVRDFKRERITKKKHSKGFIQINFTK
ncbi:MAG: hypothetical protein RLZZ628_908 [Bacteroidota bacterium]|jgi:hypothetical protein